MSENVNIDLSGEMNAGTEKKGFPKYVNDMELLMQYIRNGGGQALLMGFLASRRPWTQFVATENFKDDAVRHKYRCTFYDGACRKVTASRRWAVGTKRNVRKSEVPASLPRLSRRIYRNVEYFQANYFMVFLGLFLYCLITSPFLLIAMVASFFGYRKLTAGPNTWKIGSYELTKTQQYAVAAAGSLAICWFAGVGAVVFWVLGATVTIVALHAGLFDAESLPPVGLEEEQFPMIEQV